MEGGSERVSVTTLSLMSIEHAACSGVLLGYSRTWRAFAPIGGGYMVTRDDLGKLGARFPGIALELAGHWRDRLEGAGIAPLHQTERALQLRMGDAVGVFGLIAKEQRVSGKDAGVVDAKFWVGPAQREDLVAGFARREYGISPRRAQRIELVEELGFDEDDSYGVAPAALLESGLAVEDEGAFTRRAEYSRNRGAMTTYVDLTTRARFSGGPLELVAQTAKFRRRRFARPELAVITVDDEEIRAGRVRGKDASWPVSPTVAALLRAGRPAAGR